jgi:hypothetical protein
MYMLQYEVTKGTAMNKSAGSKLMTAFRILPHCQLQLPMDFWQVSLAKGSPCRSIEPGLAFKNQNGPPPKALN